MNTGTMLINTIIEWFLSICFLMNDTIIFSWGPIVVTPWNLMLSWLISDILFDFFENLLNLHSEDLTAIY